MTDAGETALRNRVIAVGAAAAIAVGAIVALNAGAAENPLTPRRHGSR